MNGNVREKIINFGLGSGATLAGLYHGYSDAQGMHLGSLEGTLTYAPFLIRGVVGAELKRRDFSNKYANMRLKRMVSRQMKSIDDGVPAYSDCLNASRHIKWSEEPLKDQRERIRTILGSVPEQKHLKNMDYDLDAKIESAFHTISAGTVGAVKGGLQTFVGYAVGYFVGSLFNR